MHAANLQWRAEHDSLSAVLQGVRFLLARIGDTPRPADFTAMRAMLVYLGDYPERVHHPREETELFARLRGRDADLDRVLARLHDQHAVSLGAVMRLEHQLNRAEFGGADDLARLREEGDRFVSHYFEHMRIEEEEVLPQAERLLSEAEWHSVAAELGRERDPLTGLPRDAPFERLFSSIVRLAPAPIGLGPG
jgi:hemerythrin-like domain-containing protein